MTSVICTDDGWKIPDATPGPGQSGGGQFGWKVPDSQSEVSPPGSGQSGAGQAGVGQSLLPCIKDVTCKVGFVCDSLENLFTLSEPPLRIFKVLLKSNFAQKQNK